MARSESVSVDLGFRPTTYFAPQPLESHLIGRVRNEALRTRLLDLLAAGRRAEVREMLGAAGLSPVDQKVLERLHPMFMGGNYLPGLEEGEVEIARVAIASTTCDVTAVYARMDDGEVVVRVVDEYQGETLTAQTERRRAHPLSLGELVDFFFAAWPLDEVCESNYEGDLRGQLGFFHAQSEFYPAFDPACRMKVRECFRQRHGKAGAT